LTLYNLGSINADLFYHLPHLPQPGETLAASDFTRGLGGKGANMSVAAARAAARVVHIGAVGSDGAWASEQLLEYGVDTRHIAKVDAATGHAIIMVDEAGENSIILHPGANHAISESALGTALSEASTGDTLLMQNETLLQPKAAKMAKDLGLRVTYAPAPFSEEAVKQLVGLIDMIVLNAVELAQLKSAGLGIESLGVNTLIVTQGAEGGEVYRWSNGFTVEGFSAPNVKAVDTTGAGDTFTGYLLAALDRGQPLMQAINLATKAAALMVTRHGTADVIPDLKDVQDAGF